MLGEVWFSLAVLFAGRFMRWPFYSLAVLVAGRLIRLPLYSLGVLFDDRSIRVFFIRWQWIERGLNQAQQVHDGCCERNLNS
jgi:hypothetical protein